jgi:hypothetical protein
MRSVEKRTLQCLNASDVAASAQEQRHRADAGPMGLVLFSQLWLSCACQRWHNDTLSSVAWQSRAGVDQGAGDRGLGFQQ